MAELRTKHDELLQTFQNDGFSVIRALKQGFSKLLPKLRKELGNVYMERLQWMSQMKRDPIHKKIMKTRDSFAVKNGEKRGSLAMDKRVSTSKKKGKILAKASK